MTKPKKKARTSGPSGPTVPHALRDGVRIDLRLPDELAAKLDRECRRRGARRVDVIRDALAAYLTTRNGGHTLTNSSVRHGDSAG